MKKLSSIAIAFLLCVCVCFAQKSHTLKSRYMEDYDEIYYFYNENNLVDSIYQHQFLDQWYDTYELNQYDDKGNCIRHDVWQLVKGEWKHIIYCEYEYNDKGQIITRENFNNFEGSWSQGGKMEFLYDDQDRLEKVNTYLSDFMNPGGFVLFSFEDYIYENDLLVSRKMEMNQNLFFGEPEFAPSSRITYEYNASGWLVAEQNYDYEANTGEEQSAGRVKYEYDAHGNMTVMDRYLGGENPVSRSIYHYDTTVLKENTVFPYQYEDEEIEWRRVIGISPNIITEMEEWQVPNEVNELMRLGSYIWSYEVDVPPAGNRFLNEKPSLRWRLSEGVLKIDGVAEGSLVQVFNVGGHLIRQERYTDNGVALGYLPQGTYIARIDGRTSVKFVYFR